MRRFSLRALIAAPLVAGLFCVIFVLVFWFLPGPPLAQTRVVSIRPGESLKTVAVKLKEAGVVRSSWLTIAYARLTGVDRELRPGAYAFAGGERIAQVLVQLSQGQSLTVSVTVPEGFNVRQIAERLERANLICANDFIRSAKGGTLVRLLNLGPNGVEGYLFPATYQFRPDANADEIIGAMLKRFYGMLTSDVEEREFALGITTHQMVTLASMIEKEAALPSERPLIASVFYNRLRLGMPLQSDPTAEYDPGGMVRAAYEAVHTRSPFNTYDFAGLPPGPIANPGLAAIKAALYPANTGYFYFVAHNDGTHVFSRSLVEHQRAIAALRKAAPQRTGIKSPAAHAAPARSASVTAAH